MFCKYLCLFRSKSLLRTSYGTSRSEFVREVSSKKSNKPNKKSNKITITAKNDFVTDQLNSSISAHIKRQQTIWNYVQEEEILARENEKRDHSIKKTYSNQQNINEESQKAGSSAFYRDKNQLRNSSRKFNENYAIESENQTKDRNRNNQIQVAADGSVDDDDSGSDSDDYKLEELEIPNWNEIDLNKINKDFYRPSELTESRSAKDVHEFCSKKYIKIKSNVAKPIITFNELNDLPQKMMIELEKLGFVDCTPIQSQGIPVVLSGANMLGISPLGTGKTLAMILTAITHILNQTPVNTADGPIGVILASTQEMAEQIRQSANFICNAVGVLVNENVDQPRKTKANQLLITTPDNLYEALRTKCLNLQKCSHFALYEADQMVDIGLDDEILQIATQIRSECQKVMWSASWNSEIRELAMNLLNDYVRLDVGSTAIKVNIPANVKQIIKMSEDESKESVLCQIIDSTIKSPKSNRKTLIFTEMPDKADLVASILRENGYQSKSYHNGKSMEQRNEILSAFENNGIELLVLTDVAAKNRVFCGIFNVINFDMPFSISYYVNRVNRIVHSTAVPRTSYSIVTEEDGHLVDDLIAILRESQQDINPALFILKAANADSDDEITFAVPKGKGFRKYTIDKYLK